MAIFFKFFLIITSCIEDTIKFLSIPPQSQSTTMENIERAKKRIKTATEKHQRDLNAQLGILDNKEKILKERLDDLHAKKVKTA